MGTLHNVKRSIANFTTAKVVLIIIKKSVQTAEYATENNVAAVDGTCGLYYKKLTDRNYDTNVVTCYDKLLWRSKS